VERRGRRFLEQSGSRRGRRVQPRRHRSGGRRGAASRRRVFAGSNALAIEGLLTYYAYTDDERARRYAERSLETLREDLLADGIVAHALEDADRDGNGDPVPFSAIRRASSAR